ncbi:MAG TPA: acyl-CoA dehydrogenase family protein, partial [Dongiaceae bacterium]
MNEIHKPEAAADRQRMMREVARRFAEREIRPVAAELDDSERFPADIYDRMAELGMFGITVPESLGGAGADAVSYAHVMEALSWGYASIADQCGLVELVGTLLSEYGDAA